MATGKMEWPDADAPKAGEYIVGLSDGHTQWKKAEVSPGRWQWVVDQAAMESMAEAQEVRRQLYWALRSRPLTDEEMARVSDYGDRLNIEPMVSYNATEKAKELNDALLQQFRFRQVERDSKREG